MCRQDMQKLQCFFAASYFSGYLPVPLLTPLGAARALLECTPPSAGMPPLPPIEVCIKQQLPLSSRARANCVPTEPTHCSQTLRFKGFLHCFHIWEKKKKSQKKAVKSMRWKTFIVMGTHRIPHLLFDALEKLTVIIYREKILSKTPQC